LVFIWIFTTAWLVYLTKEGDRAVFFDETVPITHGWRGFDPGFSVCAEQRFVEVRHKESSNEWKQSSALRQTGVEQLSGRM
jgi:hypothetical protein